MVDSSYEIRITLNTHELARLATALLDELEKQKQGIAPSVTEIRKKAKELFVAGSKVAASHSGSNFGYHGALYYADFQAPPFGSLFNVEWGGTRGIPPGWHKREPDEVKARIEALAGVTFGSVEESITAPLDSPKRMRREILIQLAPLHRLPEEQIKGNPPARHGSV